MKLDLAGKIRNTQLPARKALFPMFEAVVNSFQAIEDAKKSESAFFIQIAVERDAVLEGIDTEGPVNGFTVTDNGVGFNDANVESFFTSDTQYKSGRGGKGLGRFVWLKAFDSAQIESQFQDNGQLLRRAFQFSMSSDEPPGPAALSSQSNPSTTVRLLRMKSPYRENCPRGLESIGHQLVEHCLPFFMDSDCPSVTIKDDYGTIDLNAYFRGTFVAKATLHDFGWESSGSHSRDCACTTRMRRSTG